MEKIGCDSRCSHNLWVEGSSPSGPKTETPCNAGSFVVFSDPQKANRLYSARQLYQRVYQKRFLVQLKERYMSRKPFYLSRHGKIWYARIIDQQAGKQLLAISSGQTNF